MDNFSLNILIPITCIPTALAFQYGILLKLECHFSFPENVKESKKKEANVRGAAEPGLLLLC